MLTSYYIPSPATVALWYTSISPVYLHVSARHIIYRGYQNSHEDISLILCPDLLNPRNPPRLSIYRDITVIIRHIILSSSRSFRRFVLDLRGVGADVHAVTNTHQHGSEGFDQMLTIV